MNAKIGPELDLSRRRLLQAAGLTPGALALFLSSVQAEAASKARGTSGADAQPAETVCGLHLQFGADAPTEMAVSWHSLTPVSNPRVLLGSADGKLERMTPAAPSEYTDSKSNRKVIVHHARLHGLSPDTAYLYAVLHDGAQPEFASFRTAPRGRSAFTFTSFGDQGTPTLGKALTLTDGGASSRKVFVNDNLGSPAAADTTLGVERVRPLFHLLNGDLCYANIAEDRVRTWWDFWENNSRSARNRPWMPCAGNHENEFGNGPIGYRAYQTYFSLPDSPGHTDLTRGLWYAFSAGSVRVISLANDDIAYQDGGNSYVRGYSQGAQKAWLEKELAETRANRDIDWIVVCMHQVAISTADKFNGADLGVREEWLPLFDKYNVDLVVCGHEHHYERSHPLHGREENRTLTPKPASLATDLVDTSTGAVHMVMGGGGTSAPSNRLLFDPPACRVIVSVGAPDPTTGKRPPVYVMEGAPWSAVRNGGHAYGFAAFTVDPGAEPGGPTRMRVVYYDVSGPGGMITPFESFTLQRPRRD